ncbi:MAG: CRISPR-associated protein Cas4 [Burkholderiales bacterium]
METCDPVLLSALQRWCYCPRQCGLIHLEQAFEENVHTLRGRAVHSAVDTPGLETRAGVRTERALPLFHERLGLIGKADAVEFESDGNPYPVEYKHGTRNKRADIAACDDVQIAAQAMCLEEMTGKPVAEGALFYAKSKRRRVVPISSELRARVEAVASDVRAMLDSGVLPPPTADRSRCRECSLKGICQPEAVVALEGNADPRARLFDPES